MKAYVIRKFGNHSVFEKAEINAPQLKPGHVILRVIGTTINPLDTKIRNGMLSMLAPEFPAVLHGDVVGIVEAIGEDVTQFKIGDRACGFAGGVKGMQGALAELMLADASLLAKVPDTVSSAEAAALPVIGLTAWVGLFNKLKLKAGQNILIHGGVGGVGQMAVRLAHSVKANVFTTVRSDADMALAKKLGADVVINAKEEDVASYVKRLTNDDGFELIFDTVGGENLQNSFSAAAVDGVIVTTAARTTQDLLLMHAKGLTLQAILLPLFTEKNRETQGKMLTELLKLVEKNIVKPLLHEKIFCMDEVCDAHALFDSGKARGKIVLLKQ